MADSKAITKLDQKLIKNKIIDKAFLADYKKVHSMLNSQVRKSGKILSEALFKKGDTALRKWLTTLYKQGASQERLTSYLRCGLAHLCFDFIESTYESISLDDLVARALKSFKLRNYHKSFFKPGTPAPKSKKTVKKKAVKKKTSAKKAAKKKAALKKPTRKKTKKAASKKVKKASVKKSTQKATNKKPASKKKKAVKNTKKKSKKKSVKPKSLFDKLFNV